jgi:L-threonylcarbamoyladenylate synthase
VDAEHPAPSCIRQMAVLLKAGGVVVFPTETFYGLGARALDVQAHARIFKLKARPGHLPLLSIVDGWETLLLLVRPPPSWAVDLIQTHWPGPLTLILPPRENLPQTLVGPAGGVGVRWSPHPVAWALVAATGTPVVGTSANLSGSPPPTEISALSPSIVAGVDGILDCGRTAGGQPSTVLDCMRWPPKVVREGVVPRADLRRWIEPG